jgi:4-amino-4-deoxy-L-arabinose transferase-like glycosyltransferase
MSLKDLEKFIEDRKTEYIILSVLMAGAVLYRCWGLIKTIAGGIPEISHISYDGVYYAQIARNILSGDGLGWEATIFPVLQPIIIAAVAFVTGVKNLAFLSSCVSEGAGLLLLLWVYFFVREIYGKRPAFAAVILLIPYPHLIAISGADTAESLYASLVCLSVLAGYMALKSGRGTDLFLTGLSIGLTYLSRPEGFIFFAGFISLTAWMFMREGRRRALRSVALVTAGFLIFALPYVMFLTKNYGRLIISSKLPYESIAMKAKVYQEPMTMQEIEGLTENGRLAWQEYGGTGIVIGYFRENPVRFIRTYFDDLASELPWNVGNSSQLAGYPVVYPLYFWLPAILGMVLLVRRKETRWVGLLIFCPFINMFVYPVFSRGFWIYHAPYVPLIVILAVGGAVFIREKLPSRFEWVPVLILFVLVWTGYSAYIRFSSKPQEVEKIAVKTIISDESMKAGRWSRDNLGTQTSFIMAWSRMVYYAGGRWVPLPAAPPELVVEYGRQNGAAYLVEELVGDAIMEGSRFESVPSLEMAYCFNSDCAPYSVVFWRIRQ